MIEWATYLLSVPTPVVDLLTSSSALHRVWSPKWCQQRYHQSSTHTKGHWEWRKSVLFVLRTSLSSLLVLFSFTFTFSSWAGFSSDFNASISSCVACLDSCYHCIQKIIQNHYRLTAVSDRDRIMLDFLSRLAAERLELPDRLFSLSYNNNWPKSTYNWFLTKSTMSCSAITSLGSPKTGSPRQPSYVKESTIRYKWGFLLTPPSTCCSMIAISACHLRKNTIEPLNCVKRSSASASKFSKADFVK